jgi:hypothetical protein
MDKPAYKISASLLNNFAFYQKFPSAETFKSVKENLVSVYRDTPATLEGKRFEQEVFEGKKGRLSDLFTGLELQKWYNTTIDFGDFNVRISGKMDGVRKDESSIFDLKRVKKYYKGKYKTSVQHLLYFYINPKAETFYYIAVTPDEEVHIEHYKRPDNEKLNKQVLDIINDYFRFLKENGLWETYTENQKSKANF